VSGLREEELLERTAEGDAESFEELVLLYHAPLFAFFYRSILDRDHSENLLQETFLRMHKYSGSFDASRSARSWIFGIASNLLKDFKSKRATRGEYPTGMLESMADRGTANPEVEAVRTDTRRLVVHALMGLSDKHRTVFVLKHFHGLLYDEIAKAMQCSVGTVKSRMHHACKALRDKLKGDIAESGSD